MNRLKILETAMVFLLSCSFAQARDLLTPINTKSGYVARLLINEVPFPGESGWVSESDTKGAMLSILHVLDSRIQQGRIGTGLL